MTVQRVDSRVDNSEQVADTDIEAALAEYDDWVRAGRPGARPHDEVMSELLGGQ
jgi:hypothetical protein